MCVTARAIGPTSGRRLNIYMYISDAQPVWSVLQSDCVMADQPPKIFNEGHICDQIVQG